MATPKTITDASSDLDEANLNLFLRAGKLQVKVNYCLIDFDAATDTPTVLGTVDSDGEIVTGDLSWDAVDDEIDIVLTGFTAQPVILTTKDATWSATNVDDVIGRTSSSSAAHIRFVSGASSTAVDPNGDIRVYVLLIGV
jgi:hypothetical protein